VIETEGRVVSVADGTAEVACLGGGGCGSCSTEGGCGGDGGGLFGLGGRPPTRLHVPLEGMIPEPGERVVLGLPESGYLQASVLIYLVPIAGIFAGGGLAALAGGDDGAAALGGLAGFGVALAALHGHSRRVAHRDRFRARILRRVPQEE
jgi:sigma-E factor negative regulatory protein RseC